MKKRTTLELSINPAYVQSWGTWEAIRELLQNAMDARDLGYGMTVDFNGKWLRIANHGVTIDRSTLLLGTTSKADGNSRGQFGEGYKLAWLVLLRQGLTVWCKSGAERWVPKIAHSEAFGADTVQVDIAPARDEHAVITEVRGLSLEDWTTIKGNIRGLDRPCVEGLLKDETNKGKLFVKGLFVSKLQDGYAFGYDLSNVKLDRDRKMADRWDLESAIASAVNRHHNTTAFSSAELLDLLRKAPKEMEAMANCGWRCRDVCESLRDAFVAEYGNDAVPVCSDGDMLEAPHFGLTPIVMDRYAVACMKGAGFDFETKKDTKRYDIAKVYEYTELTDAENAIYRRAFHLVNAARIARNIEKPADVRVVDFVNPRVAGLYTRKEGVVIVSISRTILAALGITIATMVHEVAHSEGSDATIEHRSACEAMFASIIETLAMEKQGG